MNIRNYLLFGSLSFFVLIGGIFTASLLILQKQAGDALVVNLAGRQRMLSQKMSKEALIYSNSTTASNRETLQSTMKLFFSTHIALINGGNAPLNLDHTHLVKVQKPVNPKFIAQLKIVEKSWENIKISLDKLLESDGKNRNMLAKITNENPQLLKKMNKAVLIRQRISEKKNSWNFYVQMTALFLGLLLVLIALFIGNKIGSSLATLTEAAEKVSLGETETPIELETIGEIGELAKAFERMRKTTHKALLAMEGDDF